MYIPISFLEISLPPFLGLNKHLDAGFSFHGPFHETEPSTLSSDVNRCLAEPSPQSSVNGDIRSGCHSQSGGTELTTRGKIMKGLFGHILTSHWLSHSLPGIQGLQSSP